MDVNGEWGRKVVEVYMTWYTYFFTTNYGVMGYLFANRNAGSFDLGAVKYLAALFVLLNILGLVSTIMVGWKAGRAAPPTFCSLIRWAAASNSIALIANAVLWGYVIHAWHVPATTSSFRLIVP